MQLSAHDQKILDDMEKQFEEMTGEKPTHVFLDTTETINDAERQTAISNFASNQRD